MKNRGHPSLKSVPAEVVIERESTVYPDSEPEDTAHFLLPTPQREGN